MQTITLDKPRTLRLTLGMFTRFQGAISSGKPELQAIADLIFAALQKDDPKLKQEALEDLLDAETLKITWAAISEEMTAMGAALNPTKASEAPALAGSPN